MGDLEALPREHRNALWLLFLEPAWRTLLADWHHDVRHVLARFRANMAAHVGEPAWSDLVCELEEASPEFRELWSEHEVSGGAGGKRKRYLHPAVGLVECDTQTFFIGEQPRRPAARVGAGGRRVPAGARAARARGAVAAVVRRRGRRQLARCAAGRRRAGHRIGALAAARWRRPGWFAWASRRVVEGVRSKKLHLQGRAHGAHPARTSELRRPAR